MIDVGTGAGFPSVPVCLARQDLKLTLLDSLQKRISFLEVLCESLSLPACCVHARAEEAGRQPIYREKFDVATARAVANLRELAEYCLPFVKVGGIFAALNGSRAALPFTGGCFARNCDCKKSSTGCGKIPPHPGKNQKIPADWTLTDSKCGAFCDEK